MTQFAAGSVYLGTAVTTPAGGSDFGATDTASPAATVPGALGAVWYSEDGWPELSGNLRGNPDQAVRTQGALIKSTDLTFDVETLEDGNFLIEKLDLGLRSW